MLLLLLLIGGVVLLGERLRLVLLNSELMTLRLAMEM